MKKRGGFLLVLGALFVIILLAEFISSACTHTCWPYGAKQCSDSTHNQTCGNYDADDCYEWGTTPCPSGELCSGGVCSKPVLTVTKAGSGGGTVTSSPAGIACGGDGYDCSEGYSVGTSVTLTAIAAPSGSVFSSWLSGCTSTNGNICTVTMNSAKTATVKFAGACTGQAPVNATICPGADSGLDMYGGGERRLVDACQPAWYPGYKCTYLCNSNTQFFENQCKFTGPVCCNGECYGGQYNLGTSYSYLHKENDLQLYNYCGGGIIFSLGAPGDISTIKFCGGDAYWEHVGSEIWCEYGGLVRKGIYKSPRGSNYYYYLGAGNISTLKCCGDYSGEWGSNNNYYKSNCGSKVINSYSSTRTCSSSTGCAASNCSLSGTAPEWCFNPNPYCAMCSSAGAKECINENTYRICDSSLHWSSPISCPSGQTCNNSVCTACTPETDSAFCTRLGKNCGLANGTDNCGTSRTVDCGSCPELYWANLVDFSSEINSTGFGDTVALVVPGEGLENKYINYTIKQTVPFWWDRRIAQTSSLGHSFWQTSLFGNGIYFLALVEGDSIEKRSNMLQVSNPLVSVNSLPIANITSPEDNFKASTYCAVNFTQASYDEDDLLRLTWNFGDGAMNVTQNYSLALTPNIADTQHFYSLPGVYTVSLTAAEMARNQSDVDYVGVHVLKEGLNVMPVITLPKNGAALGNWVDFNANQSYVANCSWNMPGYNFTACNLQCKYIHAPGTKNITGNYDLRMNWTVRDEFGNIEPLNLPSNGSWKNNYYGIVEFDNYFMNPGRHNAVLDMEYLPNS